MTRFVKGAIRFYPRSFREQHGAELEGTALDVLQGATRRQQFRTVASMVGGGLRQRTVMSAGVLSRDTLLWGAFNGAVGALAGSTFGRMTFHRVQYSTLSFREPFAVILFIVAVGCFTTLLRSRGLAIRLLALAVLGVIVMSEGRVRDAAGHNNWRFDPERASLTSSVALVIAGSVVAALVLVGRRHHMRASLLTTVMFVLAGVIPALARGPLSTALVVKILTFITLLWFVVVVVFAIVDPRWVLTALVAQSITAIQTVAWFSRQTGLSFPVGYLQLPFAVLAVLSIVSMRRYQRLAKL